jgi:hypothetical protein
VTVLCALVVAPVAWGDSVKATLPSGWSGVPWRLTMTSGPRERFAAASFRLHRPPAGGCGPSPAVRAQMPQGGVVVKSWGPLPGKAFRPLGHPVRLGQPAEMECFGWGYNITFTAAGQELQAFVLVRGRRGATRLDQVRILLASIRG